MRGTLWWDILAGHFCGALVWALLWESLVGHFCGTLLWDTPALNMLAKLVPSSKTNKLLLELSWVPVVANNISLSCDATRVSFVRCGRCTCGGRRRRHR